MSDPMAAIGREDVASDIAAAAPLRRLCGLLDHDTPPWRDGEVPPLGHWLNFLPDAQQSLLGEDGHPLRGGFLPSDTDLPRRMWAGSRIAFERPIAIGTAIERRSTIVRVDRKAGRSGALLFVTVHHEIMAGGRCAIVEDQDIVYRAAGGPAPADATTPQAVPKSDFSRLIIPDPALLFRYSALTYNAHRIHYDLAYARDVEGYAGLVVHGPLTATLLMDLFLRHHPGTIVSRFAFSGRSPVFAGAPITLTGCDGADGATLSAFDGGGRLCMTATLEVA